MPDNLTRRIVKVYPEYGKNVTIYAVVQGPKGDPGPAGPQGPVGAGASVSYTFPTPTTQWTISHNLGRDPSVTAVVGQDQVVADVMHALNHNTSYVNFGSPVSGVAILS